MTTTGTKVYGTEAAAATRLSGRSVVGRVERTPAGNVAVSVGHLFYGWEKTEHVTLTQAEAHNLAAALLSAAAAAGDAADRTVAAAWLLGDASGEHAAEVANEAAARAGLAADSTELGLDSDGVAKIDAWARQVME